MLPLIYTATIKRALSLAPVLLAAGLLHAQQQVNPTDSIRLHASEYLSRVGAYGGGGQVIIASGTQVLFKKAFGYASREDRRPVTDETIFEIASASKMFTACAILRLQETQKLQLSDSLGRFFENVPADKKGITVHQLLTHTSGLAGGDIVPDFSSHTREALLIRILNGPLASAPGKRWMYSNAGYNLLAAIIEKTGGCSYEAYLDRVFFKPLGMQHTFVAGSPELQQQAVAFAYNGVTNNNSPACQQFNPRTWGGGSLCSTAADLLVWVNALQQHTILKKESWELFSKAHIKIKSDNNYGYGCFPYQLRGENILDAIGSTERGFNSTIRMYLSSGITYILVSNSREPITGVFAREYIDPRMRHFIFEQRAIRMPPPVAAWNKKQLRAYCGTYVLQDDTLRISAQGPALVADASGQQAVGFLFGYTGTQQQKIAAVIPYIKNYLRDFITSDTTGAAQVMSASMLPVFIKERDEACAQYGKMLSYRISGVYFDADTGFVISPVRLFFEKQEVSYFIMWNIMGKTPAIDFAELNTPVVRFSATFVPAGPAAIRSYNFRSAETTVNGTFRKTKTGWLLQQDKHPACFKKTG